MPEFSARSQEKLLTCHKDLQIIFSHVVNIFDCSVLVGYRNEEDQNRAYRENLSQRKYPNSNHNTTPSMAVDVIPYPVDWKNIRRMYYFAGFVMAIANHLKSMGLITHDLRWGGDWDRDTETEDNNFNDLVHYELVL